MGNKAFSNTIESEKYNDDNFQFNDIAEFIKDMDTIQYGDIKLYKRKDNQQLIFEKTKYVADKYEYTDIYEECEKRMKFNHRNLTNFIGFHFNCSKSFCGASNRLTVYYDFIESDLDQEIAKRYKLADYFSEQELFYLLQSLVSVGAYLQQNQISHGDIKPNNIFVTNDGQVQLGDHWLLHQNKTSYIKCLICTDYCYLSPQLMYCLSKKQKDPKHNVYKSDVWALGLTLLEAATLISSQTCYSWQDYTISYTVIQDLLSRVCARYSLDIVKLIKAMLEEDERIRPDYVQLDIQIKNMCGSILQQPQQYLKKQQQTAKKVMYTITQQDSACSSQKQSYISQQSSNTSRYSQTSSYSQSPNQTITGQSPVSLKNQPAVASPYCQTQPFQINNIDEFQQQQYTLQTQPNTINQNTQKQFVIQQQIAAVPNQQFLQKNMQSSPIQQRYCQRSMNIKPPNQRYQSIQNNKSVNFANNNNNNNKEPIQQQQQQQFQRDRVVFQSQQQQLNQQPVVQKKLQFNDGANANNSQQLELDLDNRIKEALRKTRETFRRNEELQSISNTQINNTEEEQILNQ